MCIYKWSSKLPNSLGQSGYFGKNLTTVCPCQVEFNIQDRVWSFRKPFGVSASFLFSEISKMKECHIFNVEFGWDVSEKCNFIAIFTRLLHLVLKIYLKLYVVNRHRSNVKWMIVDLELSWAQMSFSSFFAFELKRHILDWAERKRVTKRVTELLHQPQRCRRRN